MRGGVHGKVSAQTSKVTSGKCGTFSGSARGGAGARLCLFTGAPLVSKFEIMACKLALVRVCVCSLAVRALACVLLRAESAMACLCRAGGASVWRIAR